MEYVHVIDNLIPLEFCNHVIDKFDKHPGKFPGKMGVVDDGRVEPMIKKCTDFHPSHHEDWRVEEEQLEKYVGVGIVKYLEHLNDKIFNGNFRILREMFGHENALDPTGFQIQKYVPGGYFKWHIDDAPTQKRLIAYIVYLNTLNEEDGGKTLFLNGKSITPKAGSILIFPSTWTYTHSGETLIKGSKYIITGFLNERLP